MGKLLSVLEEGGPWAHIRSALSDLSPFYPGFHKSPGVNEPGARLPPSPASLGILKAEPWCETYPWAAPGHLVPTAPAQPVPAPPQWGTSWSPRSLGAQRQGTPQQDAAPGARGRSRPPSFRLPHV